MGLAYLAINGRTPSELEVNITAALASLTANYIYDVSITADPDPRRLQDYRAVISYDTLAAAPVTAMAAKVFSASDLTGAVTQANAFVTANPTWWFAPIEAGYAIGQTRTTARAMALVLYSQGQDASSNWLAGASLNSLRWIRETVTFAQFSAAAATNAVTLFALPPKGCVHAVRIKHSVAFGGGAISAYTVAVGISGTAAKYAAAFNVFQAVSDLAAAKQISATIGTESDLTATNIIATATATGANLNAATAGSVDIWVLTSVAP